MAVQTSPTHNLVINSQDNTQVNEASKEEDLPPELIQSSQEIIQIKSNVSESRKPLSVEGQGVSHYSERFAVVDTLYQMIKSFLSGDAQMKLLQSQVDGVIKKQKDMIVATQIRKQ